jgi:hypothetical protein
MITRWVLTVIILLTLFKSTSVWANEIYIDQAGDNLDLTIDQKGELNLVVGKDGTDALITGANNSITLNQGYEGYNGIGLDIDGDNNDVTVNQERTANGGYDTDSWGEHWASVEIDGDGNSVEITQRNNSDSVYGHYGSVRFRGDDNTANVLQTGTGGSAGHTGVIYTHDTESNNTVDLFQNSDTADHKAYVSLYTDGNTVDIDQTGTTQNKAYILFSSNALGPTDFTLSQNGGDTYGNPDTGSYATVSCGNIGGCSVTVTQN